MGCEDGVDIVNDELRNPEQGERQQRGYNAKDQSQDDDKSPGFPHNVEHNGQIAKSGHALSPATLNLYFFDIG
jgi:hypothetical protein